MYSIICSARKGRTTFGITNLALVDRSKTKSIWWTSDDTSLIMKFRKKSAAQYSARRLKRNAAKIVSTSEAIDIIMEQANEISNATCEDDADLGWETHK